MSNDVRKKVPHATTPVLHFARSQIDIIEQFLAPIECIIADGKEGDGNSFDSTEIGSNDSECSSAASFNPSRSQGISYRATSSPTNRSSSQLIPNYCYGHPDSQILVLPLGPGVNYINHHDDKFKSMLTCVGQRTMVWQMPLISTAFLVLKP